MKKFEFIFVRHALSCANVWQKKGTLKAHLRYHDPEITTEGIQTSTSVGQSFVNPFSHAGVAEPFTLAASVMLRAQQTSYLMFGKRLNKAIHVFPFIGERYPTLDNIPARIEVQRTRYEKNPVYMGSPTLRSLVYERGEDFRKRNDSWDLFLPISSFEKFLEWIQQPENEHLFAKGSDGVYRAILVTHSGFMQHNFRIGGVKQKYNNNDAVRVLIDFTPGAQTVTATEYIPAPSVSSRAVCPDTACRYPPPCKISGGKARRKTRKVRRT
jgi:hypothetical protein